MNTNIKENLKELFAQFDHDYNLIHDDLKKVLKQKNVLEDKMLFHGVSQGEMKEEILNLINVTDEMKDKVLAQWRNLESINSLMLKHVE